MNVLVGDVPRKRPCAGDLQTARLTLDRDSYQYPGAYEA
jgi:hypothetical protein